MILSKAKGTTSSFRGGGMSCQNTQGQEPGLWGQDKGGFRHRGWLSTLSLLCLDRRISCCLTALGPSWLCPFRAEDGRQRTCWDLGVIDGPRGLMGGEDIGTVTKVLSDLGP